MTPNSFGRLFRITTFGESHGGALGVVIEGCPSGVVFNNEILLDMLGRRRPGQSLTSARNEEDLPEILSGVFEGRTLGTPIAMLVRNKDARSEDYKFIQNGSFRRGHAEDLWKEKFSHVDPRGGGRSSGRETVARVMGGAVAQMFVSSLYPVKITAHLEEVGPLNASEASFREKLEQLLASAKSEGKSFGGIARIEIENLPSALGEPVFAKLKSELASAFMGVGATCAFELGAGFASARREGSQFHQEQSSVYGGIRGGLSTGEKIEMRVAVKPTSSVLDIAKQGRHDPCILLRALVVYEAMAWLVCADMIQHRRLNNLS